MVDITVNIEPQTRSGINPRTGEIGSVKVDGFEGSIIIVPQVQTIGLHNLLEFRHIEGETMKEVAEKQVIMLNALKADIDKMIAKIEEPLDKAKEKKHEESKHDKGGCASINPHAVLGFMP